MVLAMTDSRSYGRGGKGNKKVFDLLVKHGAKPMFPLPIGTRP